MSQLHGTTPSVPSHTFPVAGNVVPQPVSSQFIYDNQPLPGVGRTLKPGGLRKQACEKCHKAKVACEGYPCRRCERLGKMCVFPQQKHERRRQLDLIRTQEGYQTSHGPLPPPAAETPAMYAQHLSPAGGFHTPAPGFGQSPHYSSSVYGQQPLPQAHGQPMPPPHMQQQPPYPQRALHPPHMGVPQYPGGPVMAQHPQGNPGAPPPPAGYGQYGYHQPMLYTGGAPQMMVPGQQPAPMPHTQQPYPSGQQSQLALQTPHHQPWAEHYGAHPQPHVHPQCQSGYYPPQ
mmetsp:Transcript_1095/g.3021  ORF Transcript_1095/g.3021 Transcript_1095/m.3021 type:complete len:288 (-) Transcript_1095:382-1245(-)